MDHTPTRLRVRGKKRSFADENQPVKPRMLPSRITAKAHATQNTQTSTRKRRKKQQTAPIELAPVEIVEQILSYGGPSTALYEASSLLGWRMSEDRMYMNLFTKVFCDLKEPISESFTRSFAPPEQDSNNESDPYPNSHIIGNAQFLQAAGLPPHFLPPGMQGHGSFPAPPPNPAMPNNSNASHSLPASSQVAGQHLTASVNENDDDPDNLSDDAREALLAEPKIDFIALRSRVLTYKWMNYDRFSRFSKQVFLSMIKAHQERQNRERVDELSGMSPQERREHRFYQTKDAEKEAARLCIDVSGVRIPVGLLRAPNNPDGRLVDRAKLLVLLIDGGAHIDTANSFDGEEAVQLFRYAVANHSWTIVAAFLKYRSAQTLDIDHIFSHEVFAQALIDTNCDPFLVKLCYLLADDSVPLICDQNARVRAIMRVSLQNKRAKWQTAIADYMHMVDDDTEGLLVWALKQKPTQMLDLAELDRRVMRHINRTMRN